MAGIDVRTDNIVFSEKGRGIGYRDIQDNDHLILNALSTQNNVILGLGAFQDANLSSDTGTHIYGHNISLRYDNSLNFEDVSGASTEVLYQFNKTQAYFKKYAFFNEGIKAQGNNYIESIKTQNISLVRNENDSEPVTLQEYINDCIIDERGGSRIFYGTCASGAKSVQKIVYIKNPIYTTHIQQDGTVATGFVLKPGDQLVVDFVFGNSASCVNLVLKNGDGTQEIGTSSDNGVPVIIDSKAVNQLEGAWVKGAVVTFTYLIQNNTYYWKINSNGKALSNRFGLVKILKSLPANTDTVDSFTTASYTTIKKMITKGLRQISIRKETSGITGVSDIVFTFPGYDNTETKKIKFKVLNIDAKPTRTSQLINDGPKRDVLSVPGKFFSTHGSMWFVDYGYGLGYREPKNVDTADVEAALEPNVNSSYHTNISPYNNWGNMALGYGSFKNEFNKQKRSTKSLIYGKDINLIVAGPGVRKPDEKNYGILGISEAVPGNQTGVNITRLYSITRTHIYFPYITRQNTSETVRSYITFDYGVSDNVAYPLIRTNSWLSTSRITASSLWFKKTINNSYPYKITNNANAYLNGLVIQRLTSSSVTRPKSGGSVIHPKVYTSGGNRNADYTYINGATVITNRLYLDKLYVYDPNYQYTSGGVAKTGGYRSLSGYIKYVTKTKDKFECVSIYSKDIGYTSSSAVVNKIWDSTSGEYTNCDDKYDLYVDIPAKEGYTPIAVVGFDVNSARSASKTNDYDNTTPSKFNVWAVAYSNRTTSGGQKVPAVYCQLYNTATYNNRCRMRFQILYQRNV